MPAGTRFAFLAAIFLGVLTDHVVRSQPPSTDGQKAISATNPARTDRFGDPLPAGALARMGSIRWRVENVPYSLRYTPDHKTLLVLTKSNRSNSCFVLQRLGADDGLIQGRTELGSGGQVSLDGVRVPDMAWIDYEEDALAVREPGAPRINTRCVIPIERTSLRTIVVAPDGRRLATIERRPTKKDEPSYPSDFLRLWDTTTGKEVGKFFSQLAAVSRPAEGKWWGVVSDRHFEPQKCVFGPSSTILAVFGVETTSDGGKRIVYIWDHERQKVWKHDDSDLSGDVVFSPDGKRVAGVGDGKVYVWDAASGDLVRTVDHLEETPDELQFSPDGKQLVLSRGRGMVRIHDLVGSRKPLELGENLCTLVFAPDSRAVAFAGNGERQIHVLEAHSGRELHTWKGPFAFAFDSLEKDSACAQRGTGRSIAFSPDGKTLAALGESGTVLRWSMTLGKELPLPEGNDNSSGIMAVSADGQLIAAGSLDGIHLWEAATGKLIRHLALPAGVDADNSSLVAIAFASDRRRISASWSRGSLVTWEIDTGKMLWEVKGEEAYPLMFTADGRQLISACGARVVWWDAVTGRQIRTLTEPDQCLGCISVLSPDGRLAVLNELVPSPRTPASRLIELATGNMRGTWKMNGIGTKFSFDGRLLLTTSGNVLGLIDLSIGEELRHLTAPAVVHDAAFSQDGAQVAAGCGDGNIYLWETATGTLLGRLSGHHGKVMQVAFTSDGRRLVSFADDSSVLVWDIRSFRRHDLLNAGKKVLDEKPGGTAITAVALRAQHSPVARNAGRHDWARATASAHPSGGLAAPITRRLARDQLGDPTLRGARNRLGSQRFQHEFQIHGLRYLPDGNSVLSYGGNTQVKGPFFFWDADSGRRQGWSNIYPRTQHGNASRFASAISHDGRFLATYTDHTLLLQRLATTDNVFEMTDGNTDFRSVQFSPDGKVLAVLCERPRGIRLYAVPSGTELRRLDPPDKGEFVPATITFSPDGRHLVACCEREGPAHVPVCIYDVSGHRPPRVVVQSTPLASPVAFSPDGKALAVVTQQDEESNPLLCIREVETGNLLQVLGEHCDQSMALIFSPDGKLLASCVEHKVRLWETESGKEMPVTSGSEEVSAVLFAADSRSLAVCSVRAVRLHDPRTGKLLHEWKADPGTSFASDYVGQAVDQAHQGFGLPIAFSPDGKVLAAAQGFVIRRWTLATGEEIDRPVNQTPIAALAVSANGNKIVAGSSTDLFLWHGRLPHPALPAGRRGISEGKGHASPLLLSLDVEPGKQHPLVSCLVLSADEKVVIAGYSQGEVAAWDDSGRKLWQRRHHKGKVRSLAFAEDGRTLISTGQDLQAVRSESATGRKLRTQAFRKVGGSPVNATAQSELTDQLLASTEGKVLLLKDRDVELWDMAGRQRQRVYRVPDENARALDSRLSEDHLLLAVSEGFVIRLFDAVRGRELRTLVPLGDIQDLALSRDGRLLAASSQKGTRIWDTGTGTILARLGGHRGPASRLAFSADGRTLASGGQDSTVVIWDLREVLGRPTPDLPAEELAELWDDLADKSAVRAQGAMRRLAQDYRKAEVLLRTRLVPRAAPDAAHLDRLVAELDSESFDTRVQAQAELERLNTLAEPALRKVLASQPALEVQRRAEALLKRLDGPVTLPEQVRELRAVELLERLATPGSRELLVELARGAPDARLTREARVSISRLTGRHVEP